MSRPSSYAPSLMRPTLTSVLLSALAGLFVFLVLRVAEQPEIDRLMQARRVAVLDTATTLRSRLEGQLNITLQLTRGLTSFIAAQGRLTDDDFRRIAVDLSRNLPHLRNLAVAYGTTISQIHPVKGNESAVGIDYRNLPGQWPEVSRVISERKAVLVGPIDLIQGGRGLIQRTPIFALDKNGDPSAEYIGLVSMVINADALFAQVGLSAPDLTVQYSLRRVDGVTSQPLQILYGDPALFDQQPVVLDVFLPGARWQLAAVATGGWAAPVPGHQLLRMLEVLATVLTVLGVYVSNNFLRMRSDATTRLADSERRLREAQRMAGMGAWEWVPETDEVYWSDEVYRIFGHPQDDSPARFSSYVSHIHPEDLQDVMAGLDAVRAGHGEWNVEHRAVRADGREVWVHVRGNVESQPGQPLLLRGVITDVTARHDQEVERQHMVERLQRSNDELEQFAYVASHNLQEPLRMIGSYLQLLQRRYKGKLDRDADEFIEFAVEGATRMRRQIIDLLAFSRLHSEGQPLVEVDTLSITQDAISTLSSRIAESGAKIEVGDLPVIQADPTQMEAVFLNLIGNALKYARPTVPPHVRIEAVRNGRAWQFSIRDNGIGVPEQDRERVFRIFHRLNAPGVEGTGIGLAFCRRIIERHDGHIWLEATGLDDAGTSVLFTLPAVVEIAAPHS